MAKPLKPGQLNPLNFSLRTPIATPDKIIDNPMAVYGQSISNLMNANLFEGVTQFKAQVLLSVDSEEENGGLWQLIRSTLPESLVGNAAPQNKFCICRIPEIHQAFVDPNLYEDGDPKKIKAILRHPVFEVNISRLDKEKNQKLTIGPGSIVNVTFFDALMRTGEITGVILDSNDSSPLISGGGARDSFSSGAQVSTSLGENQAIWYQSEEDREVKRIVLHITAGRAGPGRAQSTIDYFAGKKGSEVESGKRKVSIHYAIDQSGTIVQGVAEKDIAFHVGTGEINSTSIGIEMCGNPGIDDGSEYARKIGGRAGNWPPGVTGISAGKGYMGLYAGMYTEELIENVARLCAEICDRWQLPIDRNSITGHEQWWPGAKWGPGDALNKKYGRTDYWNWEDFLNRVKSYSTQANPV